MQDSFEKTARAFSGHKNSFSFVGKQAKTPAL
jgi:hypothetical protein